MVGLPYPNIKSPELAEKMQYLNSTLVRCLSSLSVGTGHILLQCLTFSGNKYRGSYGIVLTAAWTLA